MAESKRFYVGNLSADISESDLRSLLDRFGQVEGVDVKHKKDIDGNVTATFAFVKVGGLSDFDVTNVIKQCNHLKWKRQIIRVQLAQESFMERLQKERQNNKVTGDQKHDEKPTQNNFRREESSVKAYDPMTLVKSRVVSLDSNDEKQQTSRRRYYSSSDEEDGDDGGKDVQKAASRDNLISKFETDFWNDCEDSAGRGMKRKSNVVQDSHAKHPSSASQHQNKLQIKSGIERKTTLKKFEDNYNEETEPDVKEERLRNLKILENIVGKSEFQDKTSKTGPMDTDGHNEAPKSTNEELSSDKKYWVSNSLSNAFSGSKKSDTNAGFTGNQNGSTGFSLLSKFGKVKENEPEMSSEQNTQFKRSSSHSNNPFKYESSEDENEDKLGKSFPPKSSLSIDPMDLFAQKLKEKASVHKGISETFFLRHDDLRFTEGCQFFTLSQTVDEMRTAHDEHRPVLAQIMKKKLKRRAKKLEKLSFDLKRVNRKGGIVKKKFKKKFQRK